MSNRYLSIATVTLKEILRSKLLYGIFGASVFLLLIATAFATVSIGDQARIIKDFGLLLITLSSALLATAGGSNLLHKELSKKTIYNLLSKPIKRSDFIIGKFLGIFSVCIVVIAVSCVGLIAYARAFEGDIDLGIAIAGMYIGFESLILCSVALFFSSLVVTPALSGILCFAVFMVGRGLQSIAALGVLYWILPQTFRFAVSDGIVYGKTPTLSHTVLCAVYAISYAGALLIVATCLFSKRNFN